MYTPISCFDSRLMYACNLCSSASEYTPYTFLEINAHIENLSFAALAIARATEKRSLADRVRLIKSTTTWKKKIINLENGCRFAGNFSRGDWNGYGIIYDAQCNPQLEGTWVNGKLEGITTFFHPDGNLLEVTYENGQRHGEGIHYQIDGRTHIMYWEKDVQIPLEYHFDRDNVLRFHGIAETGIPNGPGREYSADGTLYFEGIYKNGIRHGPGRFFSPIDGHILQQGLFLNGIFQEEL